jgi:hypothetical protein
MCVIACIESSENIPSVKMMDKMYQDNPHYSGLAYFDEDKKQIYFKKGMKLKEIKKLMKQVKGNKSIIQHYRIASVGSATNKKLNHPFVIGKNVENKLECYTSNDILFHNGTLDLDELKQIAIKIMITHKDAKLPDGELSDTYLLSWILSYVDYSILKLWTNSNKFVIMNGKTGKQTRFGNWKNPKDEDKQLITSNDYFLNTFSDDFFGLNSFDNNFDDFLTDEEDLELQRLKDKYPDLDESKVQEYLASGCSIYDLEEIIQIELEENGVNYDDY